MGEPKNASAVLRSMVEMFDTGDLAEAAAVVARDYLDHQGLGAGEMVGVEGFCEVVRVARSAFVDLDVVIEDLIMQGDRAAARLSWRGTRAGGDQGQRETIEIVRVADGLAIEHWGSHLR